MTTVQSNQRVALPAAETPRLRYRTWWEGPDRLCVDDEVEIEVWLRNDNGFRLLERRPRP